MKKSKFTEEQSAFALRQAEAGTRVIEVCRKMGISEQTLFRWKKYGGLGVSELRRLKQLEDPGIKRGLCRAGWRALYRSYRGPGRRPRRGPFRLQPANRGGEDGRGLLSPPSRRASLSGAGPELRASPRSLEKLTSLAPASPRRPLPNQWLLCIQSGSGMNLRLYEPAGR